MNKPLLQWKREIEEKIQLWEKDVSNYNKEIDYVMYSETFNKVINYYVDKTGLDSLKEQLQMIDDIIEMANNLDKEILIIYPNEQIGMRKFKERLIGE